MSTPFAIAPDVADSTTDAWPAISLAQPCSGTALLLGQRRRRSASKCLA